MSLLTPVPTTCQKIVHATSSKNNVTSYYTSAIKIFAIQTCLPIFMISNSMYKSLCNVLCNVISSALRQNFITQFCYLNTLPINFNVFNVDKLIF